MSHDPTKFNPKSILSLNTENILHRLLESLPQGVFWKDAQLRYLGCNERFVNTFELPSSESVVGLSDYQLTGILRSQAENFAVHDLQVLKKNESVLGVPQQLNLPNGSVRFLEINRFPIRDDLGAAIGVLGTLEDITSSTKKSEEILSEQESQLRIFVEHSPLALAMFDRNMCYLQASKQWKTDLSLGDVDLRGISHLKLFPEIPERWKEVHRRGMNGEVIRSDEDCFNHLDGRVQWLRWEVRPWYFQNGEVGGILVFMEDITKRKQAEHDQARLAAIVESCEDAIFSKSLDGTILTWNDSAQTIFGYSAQEAVGQSIKLIVPPNRWDEEHRILERLARGEILQQLETERATRDGRVIASSLTISPIRNSQGEIVGASTIARDVTAQNQAKAALQQREALLRSAADNAAVGLVMLDRTRKYVFVNAAYVRILGLDVTSDELIGASPAEILKEVYETRISPRLDQAFLGNTITYELSRTLTKSDRKIVQHFWVVYDPIRDNQGLVQNVIVTIVDITQRRQAEAELKESQERLWFVFDANLIGAWDLELRDLNIFRSPQYDRIFGYSDQVDSWTYRKFLEHVQPEDRQAADDSLQKAIALRSDWNIECRIVRSDGQVRWIWLAGKLKLDESGVPVRIVGVIQDVTTRRQESENLQKLERQIQHAQKLESLGVLAGGIAHDFNNILTSILGYTDLALLDLPPHSPARANILEAVNGARKAADLTKQMLAYSGKGRFVVQALNMNDVIEDMIHLLQVSISKKCVLRLHLMPDIPSIEADAVQLRQVIMNLIINASDAIGERSGVIAITTGVMHCDKAYLSETYIEDNLDEGLYVYLEVADSGCGMSEEVRKRIFDPFFTTKESGRGLGLAAVLGIVRGHRGCLKVYSEPNRGTTFKVAFAAVDLPAHLAPVQSMRESQWQGNGTVLVVDDEESVRGLLRKMLETMGFSVLTANDGREAVELFRREYARIRLVLLDMTMPHLDGAETFRELRRIQNDVQAILTSGYNEQSAINQFAGKGLAGFIQKPFRYAELQEVIRKVVQSQLGSSSTPL